MKQAIIAALFLVPVIASAQVDQYGRPVKQEHSKAADPVKWKMQQGSSGWIHTEHKNPVLHKQRQRSWIHTTDKDPVKYKQRQRSWIHGSNQD